MTNEKKPKEDRTPFDALVKRLTDRFGSELLSYLGELEGVSSCESVGGEVEVMHRLSDRVWRVTQETEAGNIQYLMHVEFESSYEPRMERRLGMYGWGVYEKEKLPVRHLVWYVGDEQPTGWPSARWFRHCSGEMKIGSEVEAWIRWREVWLPGGYQAAEFIAEAPSYLLPFVAFMEGMHSSLILELHNAILTKEVDESRQQDLLAMAVFFLSRKFSLDTIKEIFDMDSLEGNEFAEYLIEKGVSRGRQEGHLLEARNLLLSFLSKKIGGLSPQLIEKIQTTDDVDRLRDVFLQLTLLQKESDILDILKTL